MKLPRSIPSENTFAFSGPEALRLWERLARLRHINLIRKVMLTQWVSSSGVSGDAALKKLNTMSKLECLTFVIDEERELKRLLTEPVWNVKYRVTEWRGSLRLGSQVNLQLILWLCHWSRQ